MNNMGCRRRQRHGAMAVEMALILPLLMLMVIGLCTAQIGAFRYHQIASLAQEGARWASVHGKEFARQNRVEMADAEDVIENVVRPRAVGLDADQLDVTVEWNEESTLVTVRVAYQWLPGSFFGKQTISCIAMALSTY